MIDVSLNIVSSNAGSNSLASSSSTGSISTTKNDKFKGILGEILSNDDSDSLSKLENTNLEDVNINYEMIIALLMQLKNQDNIDFTDISNLLGIDESFDLQIKDKLLDSNNFLLELGTLDDTSDSGLIKIINFLINEENFKKLSDYIKELDLQENSELNSQDITEEDKFDILESIAKNIQTSYNKVMFSTNEDLNINGMINKNNLFEHETSNNDLSILENIADIGGYSFQANSVENSENTLDLKQVMPEIRQEFIEEDTIKAVKFMSSNGIYELKVKLNPQELGEMSIKLVKEGDLSTVFIELTNEEAYDIVNKNLAELIKQLDDSKFNIKDVVVTINHDDKNLNEDSFNNEFNKRNQEQKNKKNNYKSDSIEFEEVQNSQIEEDNLNILI